MGGFKCEIFNEEYGVTGGETIINQLLNILNYTLFPRSRE